MSANPHANTHAAGPDLVRAQNLVVCYHGRRPILKNLSWSLPHTGLHVLMGSGGVGKSTLLQALASFQALSARAQVEGTVALAGTAALIPQQQALFHGTALHFVMSAHEALREQQTVAQQRQWVCAYFEAHGFSSLCDRINQPWIDLETWERRQLTLFRAALADPALLCVDEPTRGLDDDHANRVMAWLRQLSDTKAVLLVTHHQSQAKRWSDTTALLAGGAIQLHVPSAVFFSADAPALAAHFVRTGGCSIPAPSSLPDELNEPPTSTDATTKTATQAADPAQATAPFQRVLSATMLSLRGPLDHAPSPMSAFSGPRGFRWVIQGLLAGTPQPGLIDDLEADLCALHRVGIEVLVTLTEVRRDEDAICASGLRCYWFPIRDMGAPKPALAAALLATLAEHITQRQPVAFHCHAGLGRTGTMLAAFLIWQGASAHDAIERVRAADAKYIQSNEQLQFLMNFAFYLRQHPPAGVHSG